MGSTNFTDKGYISKYGGGIFKAREVLDTGLPITSVINGISKATTAVVTVADVTEFTNGDVIIIEAAGGMTEVNDILFTIGSVTVTADPVGTFTLTGINSSGYTPFTSGGTAKVSNVTNFGYIQDTSLKYEKPLEDIIDETGNVVKVLSGNVATGFSGTFMQSNTTLLDFLRDSTENKYYNLYYKATPTNDLNGTTQEIFVGIAMFVPKFELVSGTRRPTFETRFLKNDAAIAIGEPDVIFGSVATADITIALGKYYEIVEN